VSLALARKYRPSTFDELVGQDSVSQTLSQALDSDRLSHAYLFSGLRGSGKTSTARIFAKALLCEEGQGSHPCNICPNCTMSNENRHMDIIEMDAASNRGIDDIKDLIEHTKYKPSSARYKIFIIDEVHMLTPQAFNALLKTLEEPPDFVKFILATTDPLKLPATILSRTQHFRFKKIAQKLILQHLEHILNKEGVNYEREALDIIARSGAGSLRDSLTLLDQAIVYSKNYVDINTVTGMLGIIEPNLLENLLDNIMSKNQKEILAFIKMAADYETEMIIDELVLFLKDILLSGSPKVPPMIIERFFRILADTKALLNLGGDGEFILSLTLFKMMEALEIKDIDNMIRVLEKELKGITVPSSSSTETISSTVSKQEPAVKPKPEKENIQNIEDNNLSIQNMPIDKTPIEREPETQTVVETLQKVEKVDQEVPKEVPVEEIFVDRSSPKEHTTPEVAKESTATKEVEIKTIEPASEPEPEAISPHQHTFDLLIKKIYDRDFDLGTCFEKNIVFDKYEDGELTWGSSAEGDDKKTLIQYWSVIKMFVQESFGVETKIINIPKTKPTPLNNRVEETPPKLTSEEPIQAASTEREHKSIEQTKAIESEPIANPQEEFDNNYYENSASMIEDIEMKSSCIAPEAGNTEAAKEKEPSNILEEPMIKEVLNLFNPKKVRIQKKV